MNRFWDVAMSPTWPQALVVVAILALAGWIAYLLLKSN